MEDTVIGYIYSSYDYDKFKRLDANRAVDHAEKIKKSVEKSGQLLSPIIVNKDFQIIDGQNRFAAWQEMGLPIFYTMQEEYGIGECRAMNQDATNWKVSDFIGSYAEQGNGDYLALKQLEDKYKEKIPTMTVRMVASGFAGAGGRSNALKSGSFKMAITMQSAIEVLDYISGFEIPRTVRGKANLLYNVFVFCYYSPLTDNSKMIRQWGNYSGIITGITDIRSAAAAVETVYNYKCAQSSHVYIEAEYRRWAAEKCAGKSGGARSSWDL